MNEFRVTTNDVSAVKSIEQSKTKKWQENKVKKLTS